MSDHNLCKRCHELDILRFLEQDLPWKTVSELNDLAFKDTQIFKSLGKVGSVDFWDDCPLCLCLFALTPSPKSLTQDVLLLPDWTLNRVAGETPTVTDMEGWNQFPKCLLVVLSGRSSTPDFNTRIHRGDALCIIEEDNPTLSLGARIVSSTDLDLGMIKGWLSSCDELHSATCRPVWTQDLPNLKLVDVLTKIIVKCPRGSFDYLTLSYVWGGVDQQSYQVGCLLNELPQTIEDAIDLTRKLGKRYLWVDSLCIDQSDRKDKKRQIMTMRNIYSGSYLTIIALSGKNAHSGLPRLRLNKDVFPQLGCRVNGKRLVGLMPTLSQQIWRAPWGKRAWTLQEALLAPRCLYISDHQLYFECNGMQCCESLDDTKSWPHHLRLDSRPAQGGWLASKVGDGCLRIPIDKQTHRIERYGSKLTLYSYRSMTHDTDGLNAFSGILQFLETMYTKGFFEGLPIEDFQWGLLWCSQYAPTRRPGFPSWSWAGWRGGLWPAYPVKFQTPHDHPLHLRISRLREGNLVEIFATSHANHFVKDPIQRAALLSHKVSDFNLTKYPRAEEAKYLFIECIMLQFTPDFSTPTTDVYSPGQHSIFLFSVRGVRCGIRIMSIDPEVNDDPRRGKQQFLLLARDQTEDRTLILHHLLLVNFHEGLAERKTVLNLLIPANRLDVLDEFKPEKRRVVMG